LKVTVACHWPSDRLHLAVLGVIFSVLGKIQRASYLRDNFAGSSAFDLVELMDIGISVWTVGIAFP
jgi:hypothetical protein